MRTRRAAILAVAATLLTLLPLLVGGAPAAQANYCANTKFPPQVPPGAQTGVAISIVGAYNHAGGTQLDSLGCFNGDTVHDTRMLPPRADYVVVAVGVKCSPGQTFTGTLRGLGVNSSSVSYRCGQPNVWGHTAALSGLYYLRPNLAGTITATVTVGTRTYSTTSYTALPVSQPA